jgi:hypothetical protein
MVPELMDCVWLLAELMLLLLLLVLGPRLVMLRLCLEPPLTATFGPEKLLLLLLLLLLLAAVETDAMWRMCLLRGAGAAHGSPAAAQPCCCAWVLQAPWLLRWREAA